MINFKHLHYFWAVAKQGGISRASELLHITPQTISGQITLLEDKLGKSRFRKVGRKLELTDTGRLVLSLKTIEFHLTHVFRRLDVANRAELRRLVADLP